jgi:hypothetical protein
MDPPRHRGATARSDRSDAPGSDEADAWLGLQPTHGHGSAPGRRVGSWEDTAGHDLDAGGGLDPFVIEVQEMRKAQHATYEAEVNKIRDDARKRILDKS